MVRVRAAVATAVLSWLATPLVFAQDFRKFEDDWRVYLGGFNATVDSKLGINSDILPPIPPIDVEDVLGVADSKTVAWGGVSWRFAERHSLEGEFLRLNRGSSITEPFNPPLQIGDTFIESGTVGSSYDTDVYRLTYGYSVLRNERSDLQLKAGLHVAILKADIFLIGEICDPTTIPSVPPGCPPQGTSSESEDVGAPLPHLGIAYSYALGPDWGFNVAGMGFALELDNVEGSIVEFDADIGWQPFRNFGFGVGYRFLRAKVESKGLDLNGEFQFEYRGPIVYVQATF